MAGQQSETIVVFDIETVPDSMHHQGDEFPIPPFHKVVAISYLESRVEERREGRAFDVVRLRSGGETASTEAELVKGFFSYIERKKPRLVTFNGRGFDLPVLTYRALKHEVSAEWFAKGDSKWENYGYRYSVEQHCDLMDALSNFGASRFASIENVCAVLGIPGKTSMDGSQVKESFEAGRILDIRNYCETDVLRTYLIFLRFALFRGELTAPAYSSSVASLRNHLEAEKARRPHLGQFIEDWDLAARTSG